MSLGAAQKAELIDAIYVKLGVPAAVESLGLKLRDVMEAIDDDEDFSDRVEQAMAHLTPLAEQELFRRAVHGTDNYVVNQGRVVFLTNDEGLAKPLIEKKYSDGLLAKFLEARKKDVFGKSLEVAHKHSGFIAVPVMSVGEIQAMLDSPGDEVTFIDANYRELDTQNPIDVPEGDINGNWPPQEADSPNTRMLPKFREPELIDFDARDDGSFEMDRDPDDDRDEPDFDDIDESDWDII